MDIDNSWQRTLVGSTVVACGKQQTISVTNIILARLQGQSGADISATIVYPGGVDLTKSLKPYPS